MCRFKLLTLSLIMVIAGYSTPTIAAPHHVFKGLGGLLSPVSSQQEIIAGVHLDKVVREHYATSDDIGLQDYVSEVGKKVAAQTHVNYPLTYTVLDDKRTVNAFVGPGGFIYLTTGLIHLLENESQLAAVLAHETAHTVQHHMVRQMQEQNSADLTLLMQNKVADSNFDSRLTRLGELLMSQQFGRQDEIDADLGGTRLMAKAGYNPTGMSQLLNKLNALDSRGVTVSFLQNHPPSKEREALINEFIHRNQLLKPDQILDTKRFHQVIR